MAKPGRNDPCPCGSGKKYKQCCLAKDEAAAHAASPTAETKQSRRKARAEVLAEMAADYAAAEDLAEASNAVIGMVRAGRLDEAETAAHELLAQFPEVHDGYDRLGMVYEARGDKKAAADYYRKVIAFVRAHPDQYDPGFEDTFLKLVDKLDPNAA